MIDELIHTTSKKMTSNIIHAPKASALQRLVASVHIKELLNKLTHQLVIREFCLTGNYIVNLIKWCMADLGFGNTLPSCHKANWFWGDILRLKTLSCYDPYIQ